MRHRSCLKVLVWAGIVGFWAVVAQAQLVFNRTALDFGQVVVGDSSPTLTVDLLNQGSAPVVVDCGGGGVSAPFSGSQGCQGTTLDPGMSCPFSYLFSPTAAGSATEAGTLFCNGIPLSVALQGEGVTTVTEPALVLLKTAVDFGAVAVGDTSATVTSELLNQGSSAIVVDCAGGGTVGDFNSGQGCQGLTLAPGATCPFSYSFSPSAPGPATGTSSPICNGVSLSVSLEGEGVLPGLIFETTGVDFGVVAVGATSPLVAVQLRNQGPGPVTVDCAGGGTPSPQFGGSQGCQGLTLPAGDSCPFSYNFSPDGPGLFTDDSSPLCNGVALNVALRGFGEGTAPVVAVAPTAGLVTTEAGDEDTFEVVLESGPSADVVVDLLSSDPTEGVPSPASLVFTPVNWFQAQTVTVTGADDPDFDGDVPYSILLTVTSADGGYDGFPAGPVDAVNLDDEFSPVTIPTLSSAGVTLLAALLLALGLWTLRRRNQHR